MDGLYNKPVHIIYSEDYPIAQQMYFDHKKSYNTLKSDLCSNPISKAPSPPAYQPELFTILTAFHLHQCDYITLMPLELELA